MGIETALLVGGLAVSAGSAYVSNQNAKKSVAAQNEALSYQKAQNDLAAMRQKRDAIRQARIANANVVNTAETQGVSTSSSASGGQGSIQSQLNGTLSFLDQWNKYSDAASEAIGRASTYAYKSQTASSVSGLALSVGLNADVASSKIKKVFGG